MLLDFLKTINDKNLDAYYELKAKKPEAFNCLVERFSSQYVFNFEHPYIVVNPSSSIEEASSFDCKVRHVADMFSSDDLENSFDYIHQKSEKTKPKNEANKIDEADLEIMSSFMYSSEGLAYFCSISDEIPKQYRMELIHLFNSIYIRPKTEKTYFIDETTGERMINPVFRLVCKYIHRISYTDGDDPVLYLKKIIRFLLEAYNSNINKIPWLTKLSAKSHAKHFCGKQKNFENSEKLLSFIDDCLRQLYDFKEKVRDTVPRNRMMYLAGHIDDNLQQMKLFLFIALLYKGCLRQSMCRIMDMFPVHSNKNKELFFPKLFVSNTTEVKIPWQHFYIIKEHITDHVIFERCHQFYLKNLNEHFNEASYSAFRLFLKNYLALDGLEERKKEKLEKLLGLATSADGIIDAISISEIVKTSSDPEGKKYKVLRGDKTFYLDKDEYEEAIHLLRKTRNEYHVIYIKENDALNKILNKTNFRDTNFELIIDIFTRIGFSDFDKKAYAFDLLEEEDKPKQQGSSTYIDRKFERVEDAMEGKLEGVIIHRGKNRYKLNPRYKYFVVLKSPMKELIQPL